MKKILYSTILALGLLYSFTPFIAGAQEPLCPSGQYCLLEPLQIGDKVFSEFSADTTIGGYVNIMFKIIIGIVGVLAVVMLVLGGVQYMSTDAISGKESGKETIQHALGGLILALGAFVILNTINPNILSLDINIEPVVVSVDYETNEGVLNQGTTSSSGEKMYCGYASGMPWSTDPVIKAGDDNIRNVELKKSQYNASVNKSNCSSVGSSNCTSVYGLDISGIAKLRSKCPSCSITITGGTECWLHSSAKKTTHGASISHSPGSSVVDLSKSGTLQNYVYSGTKSCVGWNPNKTTCTQSNGKKGDWQYIKDGIVFMDEGDHFHVKSW